MRVVKYFLIFFLIFYFFYLVQCSVLLNGHFAQEGFGSLSLFLCLLNYSICKNLLLRLCFLWTRCTRKISTLSFFAVLLRSPKYVSTIFGSTCASHKRTFYKESTGKWSLVRFCVSCPNPKSKTSSQ